MGQTLGFISFGRVARAVARRAAPFGLRMMAYDPFIQETLMSDHGVIPATLSEVLSQSDFVSMHAPAPARGASHARREAFRQMKPSAIFINTGRGATVDEEALIKALQEGWIAHAALDVLEKEPPSHNNPMLSMENVTLTAHVASASARFDEARKRRVGYELSLVLSGHVAGKLRQSVGAAEHRAAPLAAGQHGPRPEQLRRRPRSCRNKQPFTGGSTPGTGKIRERSMRTRSPVAMRWRWAFPPPRWPQPALPRKTPSAIKAADVPAPDTADRKGRKPCACCARCGSCRPDEDVFRANAAKFTEKTGVEVKVDFVGWEDINQQTAVTSNSGAGPDIIIGFSDAPHIYVDKLIELTDVADYLGKRYGGWQPLPQRYGKRHKSNAWIGLPFGATSGPLIYRKSILQIGRLRQGAGGSCRHFSTSARSCKRPASPRASRSATPWATATASPTGCCGRITPRCSTRRARSSSTARRRSPR